MAVLVGDCREVMAGMAANSVDTIITDPPYGLEFMGKEWDHGIPGRHFWELAMRVAKPGAILMAFGGTRTWHRLACAIEDAGWEIRDTLMWVYGSGFPKSHDISKAIDKAAGAEREVVGSYRVGGNALTPTSEKGGTYGVGVPNSPPGDLPITAPATPLAQLWQGWGTALKPAWEPIILAMKPLDGTFAHNAETWGVAGINVDGGRIATEDCLNGGTFGGIFGNGKPTIDKPIGTGRWPANLIHDGSDEVLELFPNVKAGVAVRHNIGHSPSANINYATGSQDINMREDIGYGDSGSAARFFYCAKASRSERNAGLEGCEVVEREGQSAWAGRCNVCGCRMMLNGKPTCGHDDFDWVTTRPTRNPHPCVKPIALMRYLVRLTATPTGGVVLDPFAGSGSTGCACALEGREFIGIEQEPEYAEIAERRIAYWETLHDPLPRR